jgi:hypothetical protein
MCRIVLHLNLLLEAILLKIQTKMFYRIEYAHKWQLLSLINQMNSPLKRIKKISNLLFCPQSILCLSNSEIKSFLQFDPR